VTACLKAFKLFKRFKTFKPFQNQETEMEMKEGLS